MISFKSYLEEGERGLWDNIHAKRKRIKAGSGERMRKPGEKGRPTAADFKASQTKVKEEFDLGEAMDPEHPVAKEYKALKQHDIKTLRTMIKGQQKIVDTSEYRSKDHAISAYLRHKHGDKKVATAMGLSEELAESHEELSKHISDFSKGVKSSSAKQSTYKKDGKPIHNMKHVETNDDHKKVFDHLKKMGYKKTSGYDSKPNEFTISRNHEEMTAKSDPVHHASGISAHIESEHGGKTKVHFTHRNIKEDLETQFDLIEELVMDLAEQNNIDPESIWEEFEEISDEELLEYAIDKKGHKSSEGGLTQKGVDAYNRKTGGNLQTAVTTKPSKLKSGSKAANRRKSFCARMGGMKSKLTSAKTAKDPDSRINKALRKWNC